MSKDYQGLLYLKNSSVGKPINIRVENELIKLYSNNNSIDLPINESNFSLGGESNSFLVISGNDLTIFTKDTEIFNDLLNSDNKLQEIQNLKNKFETNKKNKKLTPLYLLIFSFIFIGLIYGILSFSTFLLSKSFPLSWEKKIGDLAIGQIVGTKRVSDKQINDSITQIGKHLESYSTNKNYDFKFYVVKSDDVNAFALPGGHVVVNTALIEKSDSYQEVAGVLAHELQHVYQRHSVEKMFNRIGISFTIMMILGDIGGVVDALGGQLISLKFSRDEESEADKLGLELMYKAGIEPQGMIDFFKKLETITKDISNLPDFISTHPNTKQRIEELNELVKNKYHNPPNKKEFNFDWKEIKKKIKENKI